MKQIPVTQRLNLLLRKEFPEVFWEEKFIRLLYHLLFPTAVDDVTRLPLIPRILLATMEDKMKLWRGGRYYAHPFLEEFQSAVGGLLVVHEYEYIRGKARSAELKIPDALAQAIEDEMCIPGREKLVDLLTGKRVKRSLLTLEQKKWTEARAKKIQEISSPAAAAAAWLNTAPPQVFTLVKNNIPAAIEAARQIENPEKRRANLGTLFRMSSVSVIPIYKTTPKTPRIYTEGSSAAGLSSDVRKVLFSGKSASGDEKATFYGDLVAAQLAILARVWNLPQTQTLLEESLPSKTVWSAFLQSVGLADIGENKGHLKRFVYSTAFGMDRNGLRWQALRAFGEKTRNQLWESEIVQELLEGREARREKMSVEQGFSDPFGNFHSLADMVVLNQGNEYQATKTLMAYEAQAFEFTLMQPFLDLAMDTKEFRILFWLHDGVYFRITERERKGRYLVRLEDGIRVMADSLGIQTRLDIESI